MCSVNVRDALVLLLAANTTLRATSVFICTGSRKLRGECRPWTEGRCIWQRAQAGYQSQAWAMQKPAEIWKPQGSSAGWDVDSSENSRTGAQLEVPWQPGLSSQRSWIGSVRGN